MRVVYSAASKFKYVTQTLAKINDEGILAFTLDGLTAWIMSPDKAVLAVLKAPSIAFDEFDVPEEARFTIRTDEFNKIVRRATRNDDLIIEYNPEEQALAVTLRDRKTGIPRSFLLPVLEMGPPELREPRLDSTARAIILSDDFKSLIQDAKVVGDLIELEADDEVLTARVQGEEKEYVWEMRVGDPLIELEVDEKTISTYTRNTLEAATKPTGAAENVKLEYSTDYPLKLEFTFPNTEKLYIYIAPAT